MKKEILFPTSDSINPILTINYLGAENVALGGGKCAKIFVTHCVTVWFFPKKDF